MDRPHIDRKGIMFVISSPSGTGKTTIAKRLLENDSNIVMSVSVTTRPKRPDEAHGKDYYFIDKEEYDALLSQGELLEHAKVFSAYYGTPKKTVAEILQSGKDVLFDIDWQGAGQLKAKAGEDIVGVFILPPSILELERRLRKRAQDSEEVVKERMQGACNEIIHWRYYDYVIVNYDIDESTNNVINILRTERLKRDRQVGMDKFVTNLLANT